MEDIRGIVLYSFGHLSFQVDFAPHGGQLTIKYLSGVFYLPSNADK
ncbi:MAG TPA: hypothetical protein VFX58_00220 [Chitinophagaceae bacterium]|nr:hypothetical protein [Chitinophagaceae bacterium]